MSSIPPNAIGPDALFKGSLKSRCSAYFLFAAISARSISLYGCAPSMRLPSEKIKVGVLVTPKVLANSPTLSSGASQLALVLGSWL